MIKVGKIHLKDHPIAPHLQIGEINGHTVVVGRHYDEGTLGFFIPDGYIISDKLADEMWVKGKLAGKEKDRVKAREMHGVFSEGLFYGSRYFVSNNEEIKYINSPTWDVNWKDGDDISEALQDHIYREVYFYSKTNEISFQYGPDKCVCIGATCESIEEFLKMMKKEWISHDLDIAELPKIKKD